MFGKDTQFGFLIELAYDTIIGWIQLFLYIRLLLLLY